MFGGGGFTDNFAGGGFMPSQQEHGGTGSGGKVGPDALDPAAPSTASRVFSNFTVSWGLVQQCCVLCCDPAMPCVQTRDAHGRLLPSARRSAGPGAQGPDAARRVQPPAGRGGWVGAGARWFGGFGVAAMRMVMSACGVAQGSRRARSRASPLLNPPNPQATCCRTNRPRTAPLMSWSSTALTCQTRAWVWLGGSHAHSMRPSGQPRST